MQENPDILKIIGGGAVGSILTFLATRVHEWKRRTREDEQSLLRAALFVLEWTKIERLYADKTEPERIREEWRLLVNTALAIGPITSCAYVPLAVAVSRFVILDAERTNAKALQLFRQLIATANPRLAREYEKQLGSDTAT